MTELSKVVCGAYIDNVIVFSKSWEEHVSHIRAVLKTLRSVADCKAFKVLFWDKSLYLFGPRSW